MLANISAENIEVKHISAKLPSPVLQYVDFASRHPIECENDKCTICSESQEPDITFFGNVNAEQYDELQLPHITTNMWRDIQNSCKDMRQAAALMQAGKVPHKKEKRTTDISRYLRSCTLNKNGLIVAKSQDKKQLFLHNRNDRIAMPKEFSYTYTTVLHRKFRHLNKTQMLKMFSRHFFMLNAEDIISKVSETYEYPCRAMKMLPKESLNNVTETKATTAGVYFNADVLQETKQRVFVLRDNLTSYTDAMLIRDENKESLREAIFILTSKLRIDRPIVVRVDSQSALKSLSKDSDRSRIS